jgi:hypothetical protein
MPTMGATPFSIAPKPFALSIVLSIGVQQDECHPPSPARDLLIANFATQEAHFPPQIA